MSPTWRARMTVATHVTFDDFNEAIAEFVGRSDRAALTGSLFDVRKRTELSVPCYTAFGPDLVRTIMAQVSPEELGKAMRRPACRPTPLNITGLAFQLLLEREGRIMLDQPPVPAQDVEVVLDFVGRTNAACRLDGTPFPCDRAGWEMRFLEDDALQEMVAHASVWTAEEQRLLRRLVASLELYTFMLHGEHRDGIFEHGPYHLSSGEIVMVKDFNDLASEFLPWSSPEVRLADGAISVVSVLSEAAAPRVNLWGTAEFAQDPYDCLRAAAVLTVRDGQLTPLGPEAWEDRAAAAVAAQKQLFMAAASWPQDERTRYGMWLFLNHLQSIIRFAGLPAEVTSELVAAFKATVEEEFPCIETSGPAPYWEALRRELPFTPLAGART